MADDRGGLGQTELIGAGLIMAANVVVEFLSTRRKSTPVAAATE